MEQKKLRIGFFLDTFYPNIDGVIKVVDNYARELSKFCEVIVFVPEGRKKFDDDSFPYKVIRAKRLRVFHMEYDMPVPDVDRIFMHKLEKSDLDIVHVHSPFTMGKVGVNYAKRHKIPCVGTMHSQYKQDFERNVFDSVFKNTIISFMMWRLCKFFDSTTENWTVNKEVARIFHEDYGVKTLPLIMPNGTEMKNICPTAEAVSELRRQYNVAADEKVFLFVGRINLLKKVDFLVRSLKELKDKGDVKFKAFLIGQGQDSDTIKKLIKKLDLTDNVIMVGKLTDRTLMATYYAMADLFLFPSLYDANSLVQIEAASQKTPTLFLKGAATASDITPEVNGYLAENNEKAYAEKIIEIFKDKTKYEQVCINAYNDLSLTWEEIVKKVYDRYCKLPHSRS